MKKVLIAVGILLILAVKGYSRMGEYVTEDERRLNGSLISATSIYANVLIGATAYMMVDLASSTVTTDMGVKINITMGATGYLQIYKTPTTRSSGTLVDSYNLNDVFTSTSTIRVFDSPEVDTYGTLLDEYFISDGLLFSTGWRVFQDGYFYLVVATNKSVLLEPVGMEIIWFDKLK